jgi:hypothetical protein
MSTDALNCCTSWQLLNNILNCLKIFKLLNKLSNHTIHDQIVCATVSVTQNIWTCVGHIRPRGHWDQQISVNANWKYSAFIRNRLIQGILEVICGEFLKCLVTWQYRYFDDSPITYFVRKITDFPLSPWRIHFIIDGGGECYFSVHYGTSLANWWSKLSSLFFVLKVKPGEYYNLHFNHGKKN